mmetsp:Transcript_272/g.502  ORF Transcript_272/g.502 Transcript_272/m.502 type:complete len:411 (+) Transcript_272:60-1292(+)
MSQVNTTPRDADLEKENEIYEKHTYEFNPLKREKQYDTTPSGSLLVTFLKSFKIGADLTSMSAPIQFDSGWSALEMQGDSMRPSDPLMEFFREGDAAKRMLHILNHVSRAMSGFIGFRLEGTKPYNPILGEQNFAKWDMDDGSICELVAEQVSHHPPISAYRIENKKNNYVSEGAFGQSITFKGNSVDLKNEGFRRLTHVNPVTNVLEEYIFTGPAASCRGLFVGNLKFGVSGKFKVWCKETETYGEASFNSSAVKMKVKQKKSPKSKKFDNKIYRGTGDLLNSVTVKNLITQEEEEIYNLTTNRIYEKRPMLLSTMKPNTSRRVWHNVTYAILNKDTTMAQAEKHYVEERQRALRKERAEKKETWTPELFKKMDTKAPNNEKIYYLINDKGLNYFKMDQVDDIDDNDLD